MDFALILVVLTLLAGVVWLGDWMFLARARKLEAAAGRSVAEPITVEYAKSFFPILLLVLLLRSFLFEPFRIPSASMMPTLLEGDFIFVNKFAYGLRLPVINTKIADIGMPERGDVIVFRLSSNPSINYIKRVVGLPGDIVHYDQGGKRLFVNGEEVLHEFVGAYSDEPGADLILEQLGEHDHYSLHRRNQISRGGTFSVPEGHFFVMGDHRDNSRDSRWQDVNYIPESNLVGRATRIWMSWRWPSQGGPRWSRIGQSID